MKSKLRALYFLTSVFLTVVMMLAAIIAWRALVEPAVADRWASDVCVSGSVKRVHVGSFRTSSVLKCISKTTDKEILVPPDMQIGHLYVLPVTLLVALFMTLLIVLG